MFRRVIDCIVRVLDDQGRGIGTGFLVGETPGPWVVTCAHVIHVADPQGTGRVTVELFVSGEKRTKQTFECLVNPRYLRKVSQEDVAFLIINLSAAQKTELPRVSLGSSQQVLKEPEMKTYGFPPVRNDEGLHADCHAVGFTTEGGVGAIQLRAHELTHGFSGAPVWNESQTVIGMVVSIIPPGFDPGERMRNTAFVRTIEVIRSVGEPVPISPSDSDLVYLGLPSGCPYRGLEVFQADHQELYFGRDRVIDELTAKIDNNPIVIVTGVSGSGKSSLLRAGLAKGLQKWQSLETSKRVPIIATPTSDPLTSLLADLETALRLPKASLNQLNTDALSASDWVTKTKSSLGATKPILILDQFERLFTDCTVDTRRARFIQFITILLQCDVKILIGIRIEFVQLAEEFTVLKNALQSLLLIPPMDDKELAEAIEKPAGHLGRYVQPDTSAALVSDVKGHPGDLPLLQFALTELWQIDNDKGVLTLDSYMALGYSSPTEKVTGARGAIIKRANEEWRQLVLAKTVEERGTAFEQLFLKLVQLPSQASLPAPPSSRRVWLAEFGMEARTNAEALANSFLLTSGTDPITSQPTVEVAHEALIKNWSPLSTVIASQREFIRWYSTQFSPHLRGWIASKRRPLTAPPNPDLEIASQWLRRSPTLLDGPAAEYIKACQRRRRWARMVAVAAMVILVVGFFGYLLLEHQATIARAAELHERGAVALEERNYSSAEILLASSLALHDEQETRQHLLDARINGIHIEQQLLTQGQTKAISSGSDWVVVSRPDGIAEVHNLRSGAVIKTSLSSGPGTRWAISRDGSLLAFGNDSVLQILRRSPHTGEYIRSLDSIDINSGIDSLALSGTDEYIAIGGFDGHIEVRNVQDGTSLHNSIVHRLAVHTVVFHPSQNMILSGGADRSVKLWNWDNGQVTTLGEHEDFVSAVAISPDGTRFASGGADGAVRIWDGIPPSGRHSFLLATFTGHTGKVSSVAMNNSGIVVSGGEDGTIRIWDTSIGGTIALLDSHATVNFVSIDAARTVISAFGDKFVRKWSMGNGREGFTLYSSGPVAAVAIDSQDARLAYAGQLGEIYIWDVKTKQQVGPVLNVSPKSALWSLAFTQDGKLISGGENGIATLWNLGNGTMQTWSETTHHPSHLSAESCPLVHPTAGTGIWAIVVHPTLPIAVFGVAADDQSCLHIVDTNRWTEVSSYKYPWGSIWSLAFNRNGDLLASGGGDGRARIWKFQDEGGAATLTAIGQPIEVGAEIWGVPFNPDGTTFATAGLDRQVKIWNVSTLKMMGSFPERLYHRGLIQSADFDPNGIWVATASVDHIVKLWSPATKNVVNLGGHDRPAWMVIFSHDGSSVISGGLDHRIVVRKIDAVQHVLLAPATTLLKEAREDTCLALTEVEPTYTSCLPFKK
jgi:WD40 repeat protein/V8-like Glu-specific endopeptidase